MDMQEATIIDQVSGKKKVFIKNQGPSDKFERKDLLGANNDYTLDEI